MKYIILCGGIGKRCKQYSLPKPLNYINCKHMIQYVIESIPSNEIYNIYKSGPELNVGFFGSIKNFFSRLLNVFSE